MTRQTKRQVIPKTGNTCLLAGVRRKMKKEEGKSVVRKTLNAGSWI